MGRFSMSCRGEGEPPVVVRYECCMFPSGVDNAMSGPRKARLQHYLDPQSEHNTDLGRIKFY